MEDLNEEFKKKMKESLDNLVKDDLEVIKGFQNYETIHKITKFIMSLTTNIDYLNIKVKELENRIDELGNKEEK